MTFKIPLQLIGLLCVALSGSACNPQSPFAPAPPLTPPLTPPRPVGVSGHRILSGSGMTPVPTATVSIDGTRYAVGSDGAIVAPVGTLPLSGDVDIDAPGFLPRRTRLEYQRDLVLWPAANEEEAEAVHRMVYGRPGKDIWSWYAGPMYVEIRTPSSVIPAWQDEANAFGAAFGLQYKVSANFYYDFNEISVMFYEPGRAPCIPIPAWGQCDDPSPYEGYWVPAARATDPVIIRRVLVSYFLGPNPLPGLMNLEGPADTLSPLEIQTIRMMLLRSQKNRWPDTDR